MPDFITNNKIDESTMTASNRKTTTTKKRQRVPFGGPRQRLTINEQDPNFHYCWMNDTEDNIERALAAGYEFVKKGTVEVGDKDVHNQDSDLNSRVSKQLRDFAVYLMRQPIEFHLEDQKLSQLEADKVDESIYGGGADKVVNSYGLDVRFKREY